MRYGYKEGYTSRFPKRLTASIFAFIIISISLVYLVCNVSASQVFFDDMESGVNGWTADGLWYQTDARYHSFNHSWAYNDGTDYDTGVHNWGNLTSPVIDLKNSEYANLTFWTWHETEESPMQDQMWVQISENGGPFVDEYQLSFINTDWMKITINISSHVGNDIQIRFFFDTIDDSFNNYEGWYIDDVEVNDIPLTSFFPPHSDYGLDTDSDTFFNYLVVNVSVNVSVAGEYRVNGSLIDPLFNLIESVDNLTFLNTGIQEVQLYFNGSAIYNNGENGSFIVLLELFDNLSNSLDTDAYVTGSYTYDEFQPPSVIPTATATGPIGGPTNVAGITITYTTTGSPTSVELWYTTDTTSPYTWTFIGRDSPADGSFPWTVPADGSYGWFANSTNEAAPTTSDAPEASYYIYDGTQPEVVSTDPSNGATMIAIDQDIVITFNESMDKASFIYTIEPNPGGLSEVWSVSDTVVTISHLDFLQGTRYWVNITAVKDLAGNDLNILPYSFYFDTVPIPTTATATGPTGGPTNVAGITITYTTTGGPATVDLYYTTDTVSPYTWILIGTDITPDGSYPWTVPVDGSYGWFAKAPDEALPTPTDGPEASFYIYDGTSPNVLSTNPANTATGVLVNKDVEIIFNETMANGTFVYTIEPNPGGLSLVWKAGNTTVEISHDLFLEGTRYWVNITAVTDLAGNNLNPLPYSFYFDTETIPTTANATGPVGGPTNVAGITITYTTTGSPVSVDLWYTTDTTTPYTWTFIGTDSPADGSYLWTVPIDSSYGWFANSTDAPAPISTDAPEASYYIYDGTPPEVENTNPANAAIGVLVDQVVVITFNETMNNMSFIYTMEPNPGGLSELWSGGDTIVTISHTDFTTSMRYWVNITAAKDLAGNNLNPLPYSFYFDTVSNAATAIGPVGGPTNIASISIIYSTINNPSSVNLWYTTDTTTPYTWTFIGTDSPADGNYPWMVPVDGSYGWFANSTDEPAPISTDAPEVSYYIYDGTAPEVVSTDPTNAAIGILVDKNIIITFNETMNTTSFVYTIEPSLGGLSELWGGGDTNVTISHLDFLQGTRYWVNITAMADIAGNNLDPLPYSFYFDTMTVPTTATAAGPAGGPTNVAVIAITYTTTGSPVSTDLYFTTNTSSPYNWILIGTDSPADGDYPWTVPADGSYGWFAKSPDEAVPTSLDVPEAFYYIYDGTKPDVQSTNPANTAIGVLVTQDIEITFNETMATGVLMYTIEPNPGGLSEVWSGGDTIVTISHTDFATGTRFWVNLTALTDLAGNDLSLLPYSFYFDTASNAATVTGPISGPTNVAAITITYSTIGNPSSADLWYTTDTATPYTWTFIDRDSPADGSYSWTIPADGSYGWFANSTNEPAPTSTDAPEASYYIYDSTPPEVDNTNPANATTGIPINQDITITFNEVMAIGTLIYTIEPNPGGLSNVWSGGNSIVSISHTNFAIGTRYWVNITAAKDLAGNDLNPLPYPFYFDTASNAATVTGPIGGPTNVAAITITYSTIGGPASTDLWYSTDTTAPYTWTFIGRDSPADGSYSWTVPSDGSYGWLANSTYETAPTSLDAPEASYYIYDAQPPMIDSILLSDPSPTKAGLVTFTITFNEDMNIGVSPTVTFGLSSPFDTHVITKTSFIGDTWTGSFTIDAATGNGINTISVSLAEDVAGNTMVTNTSYTFVIDTTPPIISSIVLSDPSPTKAGIVTFTITFNEDLNTGVSPTVTFGLLSPFNTHVITETSYIGDTWVGTHTIDNLTGDGTNNISVSLAEDLAGNQMVIDTSYSFVIDTTPPSILSINLSAPSPLKAGTVTFTITFSETMSTSISPLVTFGLTSPYNSHKITQTSYIGDTWVGSFTIDASTGDGINNISVSLAKDIAGNQMAINTSYNFQVDATLPTSTVDTLPQYQNNLVFDVPYSADDGSGSGIQYVELYYRTQGSGWTKYGTTFTSSPISFTASEEGLHEFYTIATDYAGNVESDPPLPDDETFIDITLPTILSIELSDPSPIKAGPVFFTITFSENMDTSVWPSVTFGLDSPYETHTVTDISYSEDTWVGTFAINSNTGDGINNLSVSLARDIAGNQMLVDNSFTFIIDTTSPTIIVQTPTGIEVSLSTTISITFSESVDNASVESAFSYRDGATTWTIADGSVSWSVNTMTFTPDNALSFDTEYNVTINTGVKDLAGNGLTLPHTWSFTTLEGPDTNSPLVQSFSLTGTDVDVSSTLSITFNEPMDHTSVENSITISPYTQISDFSWNGNILTVTFESDLEYGTEYNVMIGPGAKDLAGNSLAEPHNWPFTTTKAKVEDDGFLANFWWIILVIIIIVVVLLVLILMRGRAEEVVIEEYEEFAMPSAEIEEEISEEPVEEVEEGEELVEEAEEPIEEVEEPIEEAEEIEAPPPEEAPVGEVLFKCPMCGTLVKSDATKCPGCGALFETMEEEEAPPEEAPPIEEEAEEIEFDCPECGALIKLDLSLKGGECPVCGVEFEVEDLEEDEE